MSKPTTEQIKAIQEIAQTGKDYAKALEGLHAVTEDTALRMLLFQLVVSTNAITAQLTEEAEKAELAAKP